ncbi:unnamed protein product [Kuraishia capsulata CBS 1993]|uniref:Uncharacterized protein n=1 Tax=Kuraishia capsulata CBS 1993 TaxID=1382522 RepID=W6MRD2_9ASCO|nr:uncharacterized protein KUCA_T00003786001 [Kuraishia capsulata CBS 1993]CDK27807.1 unnamed protein product [Kuraishia capsulata CBS 1993]
MSSIDRGSYYSSYSESAYSTATSGSEETSSAPHYAPGESTLDARNNRLSMLERGSSNADSVVRATKEDPCEESSSDVVLLRREQLDQTNTNTDPTDSVSHKFGHLRTSTLDAVSRLETMDTYDRTPFDVMIGREKHSGGTDRNKWENEAIEIHKSSDKIPSIKAQVDYQDKLWTPIDILDDVHKLSQKVHVNGSFFDAKHAQSLEELKKSQMKLLCAMAEAEKMMSVNDYYKIWKPQTLGSSEENPNSRSNSASVKGSSEPHRAENDQAQQPQGKSESSTHQQVPDLKDYKETLFENSYFSELGELTGTVRSSLQEVKQSIIRIDQLSKGMWDKNTDES